MKKKGWSAFLRRKQYVIAGALVVIAGIAATVVYSSEQEKERERVEAELAAEMQQNSQESNELAEEADTEETAPASALIAPENSKETDTETAALESENTEETENTENEATAESEGKTEKGETAETAAQSQQLHFSPEDGIIWPLEGNVILNYSMDATVYFPTLDQYKYNPGVVIGGDVNSKVYSVAKGKISAISNDEVTGCTVTVDLGDGYQAVYGQMKELNFKEGDFVEAGHVLGYVGEPTKYFSVEGSNLYFELKKDGVPVNPVEFFE